MTTKELKKQLLQLWIVYLILIPVLGVLAFLMNNIEGLRFFPYNLDGHIVRIFVLVAFSLISIPLGYFVSFKKIRSLKKEEYAVNKAIMYKGSYFIRMGVIGGNALFCIITYYGLNMTEILIGLPTYMLILIFDKPASEEKLEEVLS